MINVIALQGIIEENLETYLVRAMNECAGKNQRQMVDRIRDQLSAKADWLNFHCMVYSDIVGFDKHTIYGNSWVNKFHHHGKCAVAFYYPKNQGHFKTSSKGSVEAATKEFAKSKNKAEDVNKRVRDCLSGMGCLKRKWGVGVWKRMIGLECASSGGNYVWHVGDGKTVYLSVP